MWLFGGSIPWSKSWVNIAAAKKATARGWATSIVLTLQHRTLRDAAGPAFDSNCDDFLLGELLLRSPSRKEGDL
jgi:hypothetical protein